MGEIIAFASGKGGTGKTSLCAGIATALAAAGDKVLCIDCDVGLRNLDLSLGLAHVGALSFLDIMNGYPLSQATVHPHFLEDGEGSQELHFLTAPVNCPADQIDPQAFAAMLEQAREHYRYILLDAPAGVDAGFRLAVRNADRVLLVCGSDPASIRDAQRTGDMLELMGKQSIRLIVNRVSKAMARRLGKTVDDIMDTTGLPLIGVVPEDSNVVFSATFNNALILQSFRGAGAACRRIAKRIKGHNVPIAI